jgi:hypothetical protein
MKSPWLLVLLAVAPDVVQLRNGGSLEGEVVNETETLLTLRVEGGQVTFERKLVASIRKEPKPEAPKTDTPKAEGEKPPPAVPAGIVPAKDDWHILWSPERRAGWRRVQAKVQDGGASIFEEEVFLLARDGKAEGSLRFVEEAGPAFHPLSFLLVSDLPGRRFSRSGRVRNGRLVVETWENGEKTIRELPVPEGFHLPLAARAMVLREAGGGGATWTGPIFDAAAGEFTTVRLSIARREGFRWEGAEVETVVLVNALEKSSREERIALDGRVLAADLAHLGLSAVGSTQARVEALKQGSAEEEATEAEVRGRMALVCPEDGFRIRKPGVSWSLVPPESKGARERAAVRDFSGTVSVVVAVEPAPAGPEPLPADLGEALEERLKGESPSYLRIGAGPESLGGSPCWRVLADTVHNGDPVRVLVFVLARAGRVYTVTAMAPRASFAEARPFLQRILEGIEWL